MSTGLIVGTPGALWKAIGDAEIGLVPTMGALHDGHLSLIRRSTEQNEKTVVSIFVNPRQFNSATDLAAYPRTLEDDAERAIHSGADVIYAPAPETVYPPRFATTVQVAGLTDLWEGMSRPGHFSGVATVVAILLNSVRPARTYFGEKDYQQLVVIRRMHTDLQLPGEIVGCPTIRDSDGLALSSRNMRLTSDQRATAAAVPETLFAMSSAVSAGLRSSVDVIGIGQSRLATSPDVVVDYLAIVDPNSLQPLLTVIPGARALFAGEIGAVRLIDNVEIMPHLNVGAFEQHE